MPDITLARGNCVPRLRPGELVMADKGYQDGGMYFRTPRTGSNLTVDELRFNRQHKLVMSRHEMVNQRMKNFQVLNVQFRHHSIELHQLCFIACAMCVQLSLREDPLPVPHVVEQ
jgi:hypothetical protein